MFTPEQIGLLKAPLSTANVKSRKQGNAELSYVEGWHVIAEANRIFGFDAWQRETVDIRCVAETARKIGKDPNQRDGFGVTYVARVRVTVGGVAREGTGAGHGIDADVGLAHESAIKEAETDAMKRALMTFGNPFGLALYDKAQANVADEVDASVAEYVTRAKAAIASATTAQDLRDWWGLEADTRHALGITKGSAPYDEIWAAVNARGPELSQKAAA